jgi:hypothetical protein
MKRTITLILAIAALAAFTSLAGADPARVERREVRQHARIREGVQSGQLTRPEARRLRAGQRHVARMERRTDRDGVVTMRERNRLERAQDHQSRRIYRLKHNGRVA